MPTTYFNSTDKKSAQIAAPAASPATHNYTDKISFEEVNEAALDRLEEILDALELLEEGKQVGNEFKMLNPKRNDCELGSFSINTETGKWSDFAEDDAKGGDVVSFVAYILDKSQVEARDLLAKELGQLDAEVTHLPLPVKSGKRIAKNQPDQTDLNCILPIPAAMADEVLQRETNPYFNHGSWGGVAVSSFKPYAYRNASGDVNSFMLRYNLVNGEKKVRPYSCWQQDGGQSKMEWLSPAKPYTLYNLDQLVAKPNAPVLVTEGEKSADAASILFPDYVVVTTMFGAQSPLNSDLNPLIGRQVTFWPDNDDAGTGYAKKIADYLHGQDARMKMAAMIPPKFKPGRNADGQASLEPREDELFAGWDAADALAEGWTVDHIKMLPPEQYVQFQMTEQKAQKLIVTTGKLTKKDHINNIVSMFSGFLNYVNMEPYTYKDGHWPMLDERVEVEQLIAHYLGNKVSGSGINELLKLVQVFQAKSEQAVAPDLNLICLLNGTLDTRTGTLIEHNPDHNLKCQINTNWDAEAPCERWLKFLDEIFVNDPDKTDKIQLLQEWFGYCVTPDNSYHKFIWMVGKGGNGKSVILDILECLVGSKNVSNAHIERLADKGVRAELENKLVNFSAEMGSEATVEDGYLKTIVSGDVIEAERKYKPSFSFRPYVRLVGSTNHLPRLLDLSDGFFRRAIILTFNRQFSDAERIPKLADKMAAVELPGILAWAVRGLKNLHERGYFVIPASSAEALYQYKLDSDPDRLFFEECLVADPRGQGMSPNEIYEGYSCWCKASGYRAKAKNNFGKRLPDFGINHYRGHSGKRWLVKPNPDSIEFWEETNYYWTPPEPLPPLAVTPDGHRL
jgi:putative DNA primase/helicase